ncbi:hypothetical protein LTR99_000480 [Exophiala xenobiotica]|uniref:C2H2-type domain-containing protein n=1 Tax=Vermiconidia calcicola TaxID=1690605 RepID=A0AAV9QK33_9PEZI|nr:hypothetical protein LTR96_000859 [Exophiala xenobiotica]KAK5543693.1 hypothetical protein LTR25_001307 [Vermiconidia calcicola]KAK5548370.1 hypothetical protein LTR23_001499 [Chaetothyriales sp. CCFEE 6169]KAK5307508.1 hypothetical protein LTR99_000480 [Exophiala xenobiotica]KAK5343587.1 hypothetical protein LTR98_001216 [Exophiala xenobiotica]
MDSPFVKRPRLSMFADQPLDATLDQELDAMRYRNDKLLKSRFESIFEKYSHDFTGVGDEISFWTGEVEVDNGHLKGLKNETDTGAEGDAKAKSLLKVMTEATDDEDSDFHNEGADEVMQSIEEMAENAAVSDDEEDEEEEMPQNSDEELFGPVNQEDTACRNTTQSSTEVPAEYRDIDEQDILQKFGPEIGREVLAIVQTTRNNAEAHIEPAWRIPANVIPPKPTRSASASQTPPPLPNLSPPGDQAIASPGNTRSLWKDAWKAPRQRKTAREMHTMRFRRNIRADSEDPLQEDFQDGGEQTQEQTNFTSGDESEWNGDEQRPRLPKRKKRRVGDEDNAVMESELNEDEQQPRSPTAEEGRIDDENPAVIESEWNEDEQRSEDEQQQKLPNSKKRRIDDENIALMKEGICSFCRAKYASRAGVFHHWAHLVVKADKTGVDPDQVHDMAYIREYRSFSHTKRKTPRLVLCDFKTMVELHEGAGLSFAEIASCKVLRTHKTAPILNELYDRFRTPPGHDDPNARRQWSEEELKTLEDLCNKPLQELGTFRRSLRACSDTDIGDKLAEWWLKPIGDRNVLRETGFLAGIQQAASQYVIKTEASDDELFTVA